MWSRTAKTLSALSLSALSSGESTGVWRVNLVSNWLTSVSSLYTHHKRTMPTKNQKQKYHKKNGYKHQYHAELNCIGNIWQMQDDRKLIKQVVFSIINGRNRGEKPKSKRTHDLVKQGYWHRVQIGDGQDKMDWCHGHQWALSPQRETERKTSTTSWSMQVSIFEQHRMAVIRRDHSFLQTILPNSPAHHGKIVQTPRLTVAFRLCVN